MRDIRTDIVLDRMTSESLGRIVSRLEDELVKEFDWGSCANYPADKSKFNKMLENKWLNYVIRN